MRLSALVETSDGGLVPVGSLDRDPDVTSVVTTDLLDPGRYLRGGELVLTGLAWWRSGRPTRSRGFVTTLVRASVAALAAGEAAFGGVPADLVTVCAEAGLPLLRVPVAYSFATVTERATRHLTTDAGLVAVLARHRALLTAVAGRGGAGSGLSTVLDLVAADLDVPCWVVSSTGRLIASSDASAPDPETLRSWARHYVAGLPLPHRVAGTVSLVAADPAGSRIGGWILALAGDHSGWSAARRAVVAELAGLVALELSLSGRRPETHAQLVRALAGSSAVDVDQALRRIGWNASDPTVVVVADGLEAGSVLAEAFGAEEGPVAWAEAIGVVRTGDPTGLATRLRAVVDFLGRGLGPQTLRIGVSDAVTGGDGLLGAVAEARAAAATGAATSHTVAGPEQLSSHAVLLAAVPVELRDAYRRRVLGRLLDHDRAHRTDLVRTLSAYLASSGSWSRCAAEMHLHVNTVRYRIDRIEALTGRDLRRLEDQADLLLALHLPTERDA